MSGRVGGVNLLLFILLRGDFMLGIFEVLGQFLAHAIIVAGFMGIISRGGNMLVRAISGKEDIF